LKRGVGKTSKNNFALVFNFAMKLKNFKIMKKLLLLFLIPFIATGIFAQVWDEGLVAYYPFDGNGTNQGPGGSSFDLSQFGIGNDVAFSTNGVTGGQINNTGAASFVNGKALMTTAFGNLYTNSSNKSISISYWVNFNNPAPTQSSIPTHIELFYSLYGRGNFNAGVNTNGSASWSAYQTPTSVAASSWNHYTLVYNAEIFNFKVYRNGVLLGNINTPNNAIHQFFNLFTIGGGVDNTGNYLGSKSFNGLIDEVYVFNRALSPYEVGELNNKKIPTNYCLSDDALIAYYPFNGNGNNAASTGSTYDLTEFGTGNSIQYAGGITGGQITNNISASFQSGVCFMNNAFLSHYNNSSDKSVSVSFWVYFPFSPSTLHTYFELFGSLYLRSNFSYGVNTTGSTSVWKNGTISDVPINTWIYYSAVFNQQNKTLTIYRNGEQVGTILNATNDQLHAFTNMFTIGGGTDINGNYLTTKRYLGRVDEFYLFNRALNPLDVWLLYQKYQPSSTPNAPTGSASQSFCSGATVADLTPTGNSIKWYATPTGGASLPANQVLTQTTYYASQTVGVCESVNRLAVSVTLTSSTAGTLSGDQNICLPGTTTFTSTANGGTWSSSNTAVATVNASTGVVTGVSQGTATITYTVTTPGCPDATATRDVTFATTPSQPVSNTPAANLSICQGNGTTLSVANPPANTSTAWWSSSTAITPFASGVSVTLPADSFPNTRSYWVNHINVNGGCASPRTEIVVTVSSTPASPTNTTTTANSTICAGQTTELSVSGSGTIEWFDLPTGGTLLSTGASYTTPVLQNSITYYVSAMLGNCASARIPVAVQVNELPNSPINTTPTANLSRCEGQTTTLTATSGVANATINWYNVSTGGSSLGTGGTFNTPILSNTITYYVAVKFNSTGCESQRVPITITVTAAPNAGTLSGTQAICLPGTTTFSTTGSGGSWSSSNTAIATVNATTGVVTAVSAGTATITYTVLGTGGCSDATATRTVTVTAAPNAGTISGNQAICLPGTTTFSTTGSGGTWSSSNTAIATVDPSTGVVTGVAEGTATITYTVVGTGGCADATATRIVTVSNAPTAGTLSGNQAICLGQNTTFSSTISGGTWSSSNTGVAIINSTTGLIAGVTAGTATMTYTVPGSGSCASATATRTVTITAPPSAGTLSGTQAICIGGTSTFSSTVSGGSWSSSSTATATVNPNGVVTGVSAGTATITYTVTGTGGCADATETRTVTVTAPPSAGTLSGPQEVCVGSITGFSSTVSGGTWSSSSNAIATVNQNGQVTGVSAGTATITYTVAGTGGCANATATRTVTVTAAPSAGTLSGNQTLCVNGGSTYTSTVSGGTWTSSNFGVVSINANGVAAAVGTGTATLTYTITGTGGCTNATATITVNVVANNTVPTFSAINPICSGENLVLPTTSNNGVSGTWSPAVNNQATTTYTFTPSVGQCTSEQATLQVEVNPVILPQFTLVTQICAGESYSDLPTQSDNGVEGTWSPALDLTTTTTYTFTPVAGSVCTENYEFTLTINELPGNLNESQNNNVLSVNSGFDAYEWYEVSNPTAVLGTQSSYTASANGTYAVRVFSSAGCESVSNTFTIVGLSIANVLTKQLIEVYPNPASEFITIDKAEGLSVVMLDMFGKKVYTIANASERESINVSSLAAGVYFIQFSNNNELSMVKVVVSR
jgi:uncharacterized protein YjdB